MRANTELNPFIPGRREQKSFHEAMNALIFHPSQQSFSTTVNLPSKVTLTFSHHIVITTKEKHDNLKPKDKPIYAALYYKPSADSVNASLGKGSCGEVFKVDVLFKYPPKSTKKPDKKDILMPEKTKYPTNLLIKLSKFEVSHVKMKFDYDFFLREHTLGKYFIKMPYASPKNKDCFMLLMENIPGITLRDLINQLTINPNMITAKSYLRIVVNLLSALAEVQDKNILHCDVKPENILIAQDLKVRIIDFGFTTRTNNPHKEMLGTLVYRPPKAYENTLKSDLFSMMLIILELLGQTNREYIQTIGELNLDNECILPNEVLLGVEGFSSNERHEIKEILRLALASLTVIRLDDLKELIKFFQNKYDNHTASSLSIIDVTNKLLRQDVVIAQNITWFSTESLNSVNKSLWCSTALALYIQIQKEADSHFLTNNLDNPFIQAFINYQLPRHTHWQDSSVSAYCEKMVVIDTQISLIKQFIAHEAFKNTSITAYLKKTIKTRPNDVLVLSKIVAACDKALILYRELSLIDKATNCQEIKRLISLKKLELLNIFCVTTFSLTVEIKINDLTLKLKGYQDFQTHLNNISPLETHNPQYFMVMQNALISSLNTFTNTEDDYLTFSSDVENLLRTLALITNGFIILADFKNHYGLQNKIFFDYVNSSINTLKTLNLNNNLATINERMETLQTIADNLSTIVNLKSNSYIATPSFISWIDTQLSGIFAGDIIITGERLKWCAEQLSKYAELDKSADNIDKKAFTLLNQYTQFIFKTNKLIHINNALISLNKCKLRLIKFTIDLMRLKKLLTYAGYFDTINSLFEQALMRCTENTNDGLYRVEEVLHIAKNITKLFSEQDTYSSERQRRVYDGVVNYIVTKKRGVNLNSYRQLQEQIAASPDIETNANALESIIEKWASGQLQSAVNNTNPPESSSVSMISIFNSRYSIPLANGSILNI